jgi:KUP system potassium uptake protein
LSDAGVRAAGNTSRSESGSTSDPVGSVSDSTRDVSAPLARDAAHPPATDASHLAALVLGAIGVVFGDIGTSPLYAFRECFQHHALAITSANVLGLLSIILWSLLVVVTGKYLFFVLRADNRGEGGMLALMTLLIPPDRRHKGRNIPLVLLGVFGATLLYGDGMITPAISVLSAVEGLEVAAPVLEPFVVPLSVVVLSALFLLQRQGTGRVGFYFGPVTLVWFTTLGVLGSVWVARTPEVLYAINPLHAVRFFAENGREGFFVLGSVLLVVTGAEALYADMGHFGRFPIRVAWVSIAGPCLVLCYFGQGALLLEHPESVANPFFNMAPSWALWPLVVLATAATAIASQAVISGVFSISRQAIQLGYLPRMQVLHSSAREIGQVYVPAVNAMLFFSTVFLVVWFRSSSELAGAYGMAVSLDMLITTTLASLCAWRRWGWPTAVVLVLSLLLLTVDLSFFVAASTKFFQGGWLAVAVALLVFAVMTTWRRGVDLLNDYATAARLPVEYFLSDVDAHPLTRISGTAIVMDARGEGVPRTLLHNIKHNKVLHERIILLTIRTAEVPHVRPENRLQIHRYRDDFVRVVAHYGFMEDPRVDEVLELMQARGVECEKDVTYFFGRDTLVIGKKKGLMTWRKYLFDYLFRNAYGAYLHLGVPPNRVIEIGQQVEI